MRADVAFWQAYAIKNRIESHGNRAAAAARAYSAMKRETAVVQWPNGRETVFKDGMRLS